MTKAQEVLKHTPQEFIGTKLMYENATIFSVRENGHCQPIVDLRGFGAIQNLFKDNSGKVNYDAACEFQDSVGEHIKSAIESYESLQSENERMREFLEKRKKKLEYMQRANYFSVNDGYELAEIQTLLNPK